MVVVGTVVVEVTVVGIVFVWVTVVVVGTVVVEATVVVVGMVVVLVTVVVGVVAQLVVEVTGVRGPPFGSAAGIRAFGAKPRVIIVV